MSQSSVVPFSDVMQRVRAGSQEAAWDLIQEYTPEILRIVRRRLPGQLRRKFDSQDFVQAAWASVFTHRSRLVRFNRAEEFVAFMATVASNKVRMEIRRRLQGKKYNIQRERSLDDSQATTKSAIRTNDPSPSQIAVARERWFRMLEHQPDHYQTIIKLRYAGVTYREIADKLGFDESTVRRAIRRILKDQDL